MPIRVDDDRKTFDVRGELQLTERDGWLSIYFELGNLTKLHYSVYRFVTLSMRVAQCPGGQGVKDDSKG